MQGQVLVVDTAGGEEDLDQLGLHHQDLLLGPWLSSFSSPGGLCSSQTKEEEENHFIDGRFEPLLEEDKDVLKNMFILYESKKNI